MSHARIKPERRTVYSRTIPGADGNYYWPVQMCRQRGFLSIHQSTRTGFDNGSVLLSPAQVRALMEFVRHVPRRRAKKRKA